MLSAAACERDDGDGGPLRRCRTVPDAPTQPTQGKTRSDVDSQASSSGTANDSRTDTSAPDGGPATGPMPVWPQERPAPDADPAAPHSAPPAAGPAQPASAPYAGTPDAGQPTGPGQPAGFGASGAAQPGPGAGTTQSGPPPVPRSPAEVTAAAVAAPGPYPVTGPVEQATQTFPTMPGVPRRDAVLGAQAPAPGPAPLGDGPRMRQLAIAAIWALVLCVGGIGCGIWALVGIVSGATNGWFEPTIIVTGIVGLAFSAAAFPLVDRRGLPWLLLGLGTVTLITGFVLTANAI